MQHIQYVTCSPSKVTTARRLPRLRGTLRHIIFLMPSHRPTSPSSSLVTARVLADHVYVININTVL